MEVIPILNISIWSIVKGFVIFGMCLYLVFSLVVVRQVQLMTKTLEIGFEWPIKVLSFVHFLFAVAVLLFAIIIL